VILLGAAIAFASAVANALALVLQAMEARHSPAEDASSFKLLLGLARRPRWLLGTTLVVLAWPMNIVALGFAPITVVQPIFSSFQLVLLALAHFWLKERTGLREWSGALGIVTGVTVLILAAPHRSVLHPGALRLAPPVILLGGGTIVLQLLSRAFHRSGKSGRFVALTLTVGAGLGYAWADLVDKIVSNDLSSHHLAVAGLWLVGVVVIAGLAFTSEQTALQTRPASEVGPLVGALQEPLPVICALWAGLEVWQGGVGRALVLAAGLALVGVGATVIAHSPVIATVVTDDRTEVAPTDGPSGA
jgi:4-amino-4-deoxy-L-arabinose transferase-like glycosyltransferase